MQRHRIIKDIAVRFLIESVDLVFTRHSPLGLLIFAAVYLFVVKLILAYPALLFLDLLQQSYLPDVLRHVRAESSLLAKPLLVGKIALVEVLFLDFRVEVLARFLKVHWQPLLKLFEALFPPETPFYI